MLLQLAVSTSNLKHQKTLVEMLLLAGAEPNFSSRLFSYVGPSLTPLVEYVTYTDCCDYTLVRMLLQYGARVSFRLPTRLLKIRQPSGVLNQVVYRRTGHIPCLRCSYVFTVWCPLITTVLQIY